MPISLIACAADKLVKNINHMIAKTMFLIDNTRFTATA
jgi:hypothetical protein